MSKKGNRTTAEIPAGSMADIAFLLLIFFLVTTTMDTERGLQLLLPPIPDGPPPIVDVRQRNIQIVLVNQNDDLLVDGEYTRIERLRERTKEFISNPHNRSDMAESPDKAIISLRADRGTSYEMYIHVQNELKGAYNELRDDEAMRQFGRRFRELPPDAQRAIREIYPQRISEAEPEEIGEG
jgi:biopolymer transport protein ExbD